MFWKPRTLTLMTQRVGTSPWTRASESQKRFIPRIQELDIDYIILIKQLYIDRPLIGFFDAPNPIASAVWENDYYRAYQVIHK